MLKLWGRINSLNVQKVLWLLDELDIPFERTDAGLAFGVVNEPRYRALNPNGRVPTIEDEGFVLWESNTIVRYLASKHAPGTLWPTEPRARADAERWMDWASTMIGPVFAPMYQQLIRTPAGKRDAAVIARSVEETNKVFQVLEAHLRDKDFVTGKALGIGDFPVGPFVHRYLALPIERPPVPAIEAYYARLKERPGYARWVVQPLT